MRCLIRSSTCSSEDIFRMTVLGIAFALIALLILAKALQVVRNAVSRKRRPGEPLVVPGNWFLGSAGDFSRHAVHFLHSACRRYGSVFTIRLINQHLTLIMNPHSYESFSSEKNFSFQAIQEQVNRNVFNYKLLQPKRILVETSKALKGENLVSALEKYSENLNVSCDKLWNLREVRNSSSEMQNAKYAANFGEYRWNGVLEYLSLFLGSLRAIWKDSTPIGTANDSFEAKETDDQKCLRNEPSAGAQDYPYLSTADSIRNGIDCTTELNIKDDEVEEWRELKLRHFTSRTMFDAIFHTIFGRSDDDVHQHFNSFNVFRSFETFHCYFNYLWLGFPMGLFSKAVQSVRNLLSMPDSEEFLSRSDISEYLRRVLRFLQNCGQSEADIKGHNLVYLHVNYNTFRLSFWVLYNILKHNEAMEALQAEILETIGDHIDTKSNKVLVDIKAIERMKVLDSIVQESCRLSSGVFMVRYVTEDTWFSYPDNPDANAAASSQRSVASSTEEASAVVGAHGFAQSSSCTVPQGKFLIRKGDRVAMYPPAVHYNPEIFSQPEVFKYNRFIDSEFYANGRRIRRPVMGFGTLCPGRRYALLQIKWFILTLCTRFEFQPLQESQCAEYDIKYYGHEILPPVADVLVKYKRKNSFPDIILSSRFR